jgi:hypothetical protein
LIQFDIRLLAGCSSARLARDPPTAKRVLMDRATSAPITWLEGAQYRQLHHLDRPGFAWEFLRRNPDYRAFARKLSGERSAAPRTRLSRAHAQAGRWGLIFRRR